MGSRVIGTKSSGTSGAAVVHRVGAAAGRGPGLLRGWPICTYWMGAVGENMCCPVWGGTVDSGAFAGAVLVWPMASVLSDPAEGALW